MSNLLDPEKIQDSEANAGSHDDLGTHAERKEAELESLNKSWNTDFDKKNTKKKFWTTKKVVTGGVAGLILGVMFVVSTILQGPLMIIHAGQLLSRFHFANDSSFMDNRTGKILKHVRTIDNPERRRLGIVGNTFADHYTTKLSNAGITPDYSGPKGTLNHIDIDTRTGASTIADLESRGYTIDTTNAPPGKVRVQVGGVDDINVKSLTSTLVDSMEIDGVNGAVSKRLLSKRSGYISMFHPLQKLAERGDISFREFVQRHRNKAKADISGDANGIDGRVSGEIVDDVDALREVDTPTPKIKAEYKARIGKTAGVVGAAVLVCSIQKLGDSIPDLKHANQVIPLINQGMRVVTIAAQEKAGSDDIDLQELGIVAGDFYKTADESAEPDVDPFVNTSFFADASIQTELNQPVTGIDSMANSKPSTGKPLFFRGIDYGFDQIKSTLGFFGGLVDVACSALTTRIGDAAATLLDLVLAGLTGGGTLAVGVATEAGAYAASNAFGDDLIAWLVGDVVDTAAQGAQFGGQANTGVALAARDACASHGCIDLTDREAVELDLDRRQREVEETKNMSIFARYLDLTQPTSLASSLVFHQPVLANMANLTTLNGREVVSTLSPTSLFSSFFSSLFNMTNSKAYAAVNSYDYGFKEKGFTLEEINNPAYDNPFDIAEYIEDPTTYEEYGDRTRLDYLNDTYGECFNMTVNPSTGRLVSGNDIIRLDGRPTDSDCNNRSNTLLTKYRFYLVDLTNVKSMQCYEGLDESACTEMGFDIAESSSTTLTPAGQCPSGPVTQDETINVQGITVHRCISQQIDTLLTEAKADGLVIGGGGWRDPQKQIELRIKHCGETQYEIYELSPKRCTPPTARPGASLHERGLAIDFSCDGVTIKNKSSVGDRRTSPNNACWQWLDQNAARFGLKQLDSEAWHWSTSGG